MDYIHKIVGFHSSEIETIESFRRLILRREIYYIVDMHFSTYNSYSQNFLEPYEDPSFLSLINERKYALTCEILMNLNERRLQIPHLKNINLLMVSSSINNMTERLNVALEEYKSQLESQLAENSKNMTELLNYTFSGEDINVGNK